MLHLFLWSFGVKMQPIYTESSMYETYVTMVTEGNLGNRYLLADVPHVTTFGTALLIDSSVNVKITKHISISNRAQNLTV